MSPPAISHQRCSVLRLSNVSIRASVHLCPYTESLLAWHLTNHVREFHYIYNFGAVWDKDELMTFWDQGYSETRCTYLVEAYRSTVHCRRSSGFTLEGSLIEQGLTSHQTHYRSYRGRFLQVIWPNQQCQSTEGSQLVFQIRLESHQDHSTMSQ